MKTEVRFVSNALMTWHGEVGLSQIGIDIKKSNGNIINVPWYNVLWMEVTPDPV